MEKSYFIHNIDWDIDITDDLKRLPVATTLTIEVEEDETEMEIAEKLTNEISDIYEFCVFNFYYTEIENITDKTYMRKFVLDYAKNGFSEDNYIATLRYLITTYCVIFDIEVDTYEWDCLIEELWDINKDRIDCTKDNFDNEMCRNLV